MKEEQINVVYKVFGALEELKNTSGKIDKINLFASHIEQGDEDIINTLEFLLDEMIVTNIAAKKVVKTFDAVSATTKMGKSLMAVDASEHIHDYQGFIDFLRSARGTDKHIFILQAYIANFPHDLKKFLTELATKKYKIGASADSYNKAAGEQRIRVFSCQLAHPFSKYVDKVNAEDEYYATQKLDGHRTICEVESMEKMTFYTRKGHKIEGLDEIQCGISNIQVEIFNEIHDHIEGSSYTPFRDGFVLDGEIVVADKEAPYDKVFSETSKVIRRDGVKTGLKFMVFDIVPLADFRNGASGLSYQERRNFLDTIFADFESSYVEKVEVLKQGKIDSFNTLLEEADAKGWEGIMLNSADGEYKCKRTKDLLKMKTFFTDDLLVIDVFEGEGRHKGRLGGAIVQYGSNTVRVGSGFTDIQREFFWETPDDLIGKVIEVAYFEVSENSKTGEKSLRFPVFKDIRHDKTAADVNIESGVE